MNSPIQIDTKWSKPIQAGERTIIVLSRALQIRIPFLRGGLVWNRPVSVLVQFPDGRDQILPVRDMTRRTELSLALSGIVGAVFMFLVLARRSR